MGILHASGLDPWVIDFSSPGGRGGAAPALLAAHASPSTGGHCKSETPLATILHFVGYSQGGMFCYQAAYRRSKGHRFLVAFGSLSGFLAAFAHGHPGNIGAAVAIYGRCVFNRLDRPSWIARMGFQMMDPLKTAKAQVDFVASDADTEACCRGNNSARRSKDGSGRARRSRNCSSAVHRAANDDGWFRHRGQMVTLTSIALILAFIGEVDDIGQPASSHAASGRPRPIQVYECLIRAGPSGLVMRDPERHSRTGRPWPTGCALDLRRRRKRKTST